MYIRAFFYLWYSAQVSNRYILTRVELIHTKGEEKSFALSSHTYKWFNYERLFDYSQNKY